MKTEHNFVVCAYDFNGKGLGTPIEQDNIIKHFKDENLFWLHMDIAAKETKEWLHKNAHFLDKITINALLAAETRPRFVQHEDSALIILRGVNLQEGGQPEDMISIRLWIDKTHILSTRLRKLRSIQDMRTALEEGKGPTNSGDFISTLIHSLTERMEPIISELDDDTDQIEEAILEEPDTKLRHAIIDVRKRAIALRRYIAPQKEALSALRSSNLGWLSNNNKRSIQESLDRLGRYIEELDAIRERAQIVKDELTNALADKMNRNMYVLSIVAALFLPLGFLTGLLGINVGGIPGTENDLAFWIVSGLCAAFIVIVLGFFRFLKWI